MRPRFPWDLALWPLLPDGRAGTRIHQRQKSLGLLEITNLKGTVGPEALSTRL